MNIRLTNLYCVLGPSRPPQAPLLQPQVGPGPSPRPPKQEAPLQRAARGDKGAVRPDPGQLREVLVVQVPPAPHAQLVHHARRQKRARVCQVFRQGIRLRSGKDWGIMLKD